MTIKEILKNTKDTEVTINFYTHYEDCRICAKALLLHEKELTFTGSTIDDFMQYLKEKESYSEKLELDLDVVQTGINTYRYDYMKPFENYYICKECKADPKKIKEYNKFKSVFEK